MNKSNNILICCVAVIALIFSALILSESKLLSEKTFLVKSEPDFVDIINRILIGRGYKYSNGLWTCQSGLKLHVSSERFDNEYNLIKLKFYANRASMITSHERNLENADRFVKFIKTLPHK
jgi:hypothetical protein